MTAVFLSAFVAIELTVQRPLVRLRLLTRRNFGIGVLVNVLVGFALFGTVYILPQYLGQVQRYNAEQIGNVLAWTGLPQLLLIPLVPLLMKRYDPRYIGFLGISIFAASCFMNMTLSPDTAGDQLLTPNIARAIGHPQAYRAVGMSNNRNPIAIVVPCHRVIASSGSLCGYGGGLELKRKLLELERGSLRTPVNGLTAVA